MPPRFGRPLYEFARIQSTSLKVREHMQKEVLFTIFEIEPLESLLGGNPSDPKSQVDIDSK